MVYDETTPEVLSEVVAEYSDRGSADAIAGILEGEGVRTKVVPANFVAGMPSIYRVLVGANQAHRARWVLEGEDFSDSELNFLATGKLGSDPEGDLE